MMLTGDKEEVARQIAEQTKVTEYHADLLPADKVDYITRFITAKKEGENDSFCWRWYQRCACTGTC